jgi:CheY-like chemotaxis protein
VIAERTMAQKRILVVDNSMTTRMLVQFLLESERYEVDTAVDRADAIAKAKAHTPDLILMDVRMPLAALPSAEAGRFFVEKRVIQIISVAAHGVVGGERVAFECDRLGYVTRPIDPVELLAKVQRCLGE